VSVNGSSEDPGSSSPAQGAVWYDAYFYLALSEGIDSRIKVRLKAHVPLNNFMHSDKISTSSEIATDGGVARSGPASTSFIACD